MRPEESLELCKVAWPPQGQRHSDLARDPNTPKFEALFQAVVSSVRNALISVGIDWVSRVLCQPVFENAFR